MGIKEGYKICERRKPRKCVSNANESLGEVRVYSPLVEREKKGKKKKIRTKDIKDNLSVQNEVAKPVQRVVHLVDHLRRRVCYGDDRSGLQGERFTIIDEGCVRVGRRACGWFRGARGRGRLGTRAAFLSGRRMFRTRRCELGSRRRLWFFHLVRRRSVRRRGRGRGRRRGSWLGLLRARFFLRARVATRIGSGARATAAATTA